MTVDQSWFSRPPGTKLRTSAGGIIVRLHDGKAFVALVRGEGDGEGYVLPKGGVDYGETLEEAARREIEEEAGISQVDLVKSLGKKSRLSFDRRRWITTHYYLYTTRQIITQPTDPHIKYVTEWFCINEPIPALFWPEQQELLESARPDIHKLTT